MAFDHGGFLSYRRLEGAQNYAVLIEDLYTQLDDVVRRFARDGLFRDKDDMKGGAFLEPKIARALCHSACLVSVYIPMYFDTEKSYCAREFKAMERLEEKRLSLLSPAARDNGLIITIVFNGFSFLPEEIKRRRLVYDFEKYLLEKTRLSKSKEARKALNEIGAYIGERFLELQEIQEEACRDCPGFILPAEEEIISWVQQVKRPRAKLPGRL